MKIAFIGAGHVGAPLAAHLARAGHQVQLAQSKASSDSINNALERTALLAAAPIEDAVRAADVVFLAIPFKVNGVLLPQLASLLEGKILVDCTNPVGPGLSHGLGEQSGSAHIQALVPGAHIVKAFSIYGYENFEDPSFPDDDVRPVMLYCGDDQASKDIVGALIEDCGFEPLDVGGIAQALHLEHMTLLWVRLVRANGHSPHLTWAALRRPRAR